MEKVDNQIFAGRWIIAPCLIRMRRRTRTIPSDGSIPPLRKSLVLGFDVWKISGGAGDTLPTIVPETTNAFKDFNKPGVSDIYTYVPYGGRTAARSTDRDQALYRRGQREQPERGGTGQRLDASDAGFRAPANVFVGSRTGQRCP